MMKRIKPGPPNTFESLRHALLDTNLSPPTPDTPTEFADMGVNFMTPIILGYVEGPDGIMVEVSFGEFLGDPLYGVTWPRLPDGSTDDRSNVYSSLNDAVTGIY